MSLKTSSNLEFHLLRFQDETEDDMSEGDALNYILKI